MNFPKAIFIAIFCALSFGVQAAEMTVTGQGIVEVAPDMATITLGVTNQAKTAAKALEENSKATARVLDQVAKSGVAARDIQTSGLSLSPN